MIGIDNNQRREFFGPAGDTTWNLERLKRSTYNFRHYALDILDRAGVMSLFAQNRFDLVAHCAAQPSHDKAREIPLVDFEVNALGAMNLLEATRQHCPGAVFIMMSINKVYGDAPNEKPLKELASRYDCAKGDHICHISDLRKLRAHYPNWSVTRSLDHILTEIIESQTAQLGSRC